MGERRESGAGAVRRAPDAAAAAPAEEEGWGAEAAVVKVSMEGKVALGERAGVAAKGGVPLAKAAEAAAEKARAEAAPGGAAAAAKASREAVRRALLSQPTPVAASRGTVLPSAAPAT